jgi:hypothetical protein
MQPFFFPTIFFDYFLQPTIMSKAFFVVLLLCNLTNTVALNAFGQALRSLKQTDGQRAFANHLRSYNENMNASKIVVVSGPAGSGKVSVLNWVSSS